MRLLLVLYNTILKPARFFFESYFRNLFLLDDRILILQKASCGKDNKNSATIYTVGFLNLDKEIEFVQKLFLSGGPAAGFRLPVSFKY